MMNRERGNCKSEKKFSVALSATFDYSPLTIDLPPLAFKK
jgi:hypothetical protein